VALKGGDEAVTDTQATYRIERWHAGVTEVLAYTADEQAPETALAPLAEVLIAQLAPGELVLIEQHSGLVVARHASWTPPATREVPP
jgi:hypothetical protein